MIACGALCVLIKDLRIGGVSGVAYHHCTSVHGHWYFNRLTFNGWGIREEKHSYSDCRSFLLLENLFT